MFSVRAVRRPVLVSAVLGLVVLASGCTSTTASTVTVSTQVVATAIGAATNTGSAANSGSASPSRAVSSTGSTAVSVPAIPSTGTTTSASAKQTPSRASTISTTTTSSSKVVVLPPVAKVTASPAFGTTDMSPAGSLVLSVVKGKIKDFKLSNPEGKSVKGAISADGTKWTVGEVLGYGKIYTATGSAVGTDGKAVPIKGTYKTVEPDIRVRVNVSPGDGDVVGVASPVIVRFGMEPADRAAVERRMEITTTPKVEGAWAWIKHDDGSWAMDWRPKNYWPAGTKVHVAANVYGVKFGDGAYGSDDVTANFTIGRNQVVYADAKSHHIVVKRNGKTVADYPSSYGSGDDIGDKNRVTRSGIHVVNELLPVHKMSNPAYGYVNVTEYWDVRISDNGEFIHQNQGTVGDQGSVNVSHGCINLSAKNAEAYFKSALLGDPVEITGTSVQLSDNDGDLFDWTIKWSDWLKLSAR